MKRRNVYILLGSLTALYLVLTIALPPDPASLSKYHITALAARLLGITVIIPIIAIWGAAVYGYLNLKSYAELVSDSPDGFGFTLIANGLGVLAFGLIFNQIIVSLLSYAARTHPDFIVVNRLASLYLPLIFSLAGFLYINYGAEKLLRTLKKLPNRHNYNPFMIMVFTLAAVYSFIIFTNPSRNSHEVYAMPDFLIIATVIVPYLFTWYLGTFAAIWLNFYNSRVKGIIYKKSLKLLTLGLGGVIGASIIIQFLTAISNDLVNLSFNAILLVLYILLVVLSVGYVLIALGSKKLKKIEVA